MFIILGTIHFPCRSRFSLGFKLLLTWDLLKIFITLVCWWWCSLIVVVCLRKYFILFLICIFLGYRILSQLYLSQHLKRGASVLWLTLFNLPNLLSSPFFCSTVSVFPSSYISLVDCLKPWIMMCCFIVVVFLVLELIELLC